MPQLPLDTVLRSLPRHEAGSELSAQLLAICERKRIGWCNIAASQAGIQPGMSEGNARALAGSLQLFPRDAHREATALKEAALWCLRFTPHVVLRTFGLLMEVAPSLRLFNGIDNLAAHLLAGMHELGLQVQAATAPTATGAWLRAQCEDRAFTSTAASFHAMLDVLPLHVLESVQAHLETLSGIGCHTLGQLRRLPRSGITRRFGSALLREMDRAYGEEAEAHKWFEAPIVFDAQLELPSRVESTEALLFAARRLLLQLTGWLTARHAAAAGITLHLHHESTRHRDHRSTAVHIALGMPSRDLAHLTLLLRERLDQLDLVAPVIELSLKADQIVEQSAPNTELFPAPASDAESTERLVERLQSRLGAEAVRQLALCADHRPEKSTATPVFASRGRRARKEAQCIPHSASARPAWLLKQPLALIMRRDKPFYQTPLILLTGPERIESGWWDDALATRDYFIAQNEAHLLLWIFRQRTLGDAAGSGWFLHGFFG